MNRSGMKNLIVYVAGIAIFIFAFVFFVTASCIGFSVKEICKEARGRYGGDCTESLVKYVNDESNTLRKRNQAVWALGQLGDSRALHALEKLYTGKPCRHETELCQYELRKAIKLLKGNFNASAFVWR